MTLWSNFVRREVGRPWRLICESITAVIVIVIVIVIGGCCDAPAETALLNFIIARPPGRASAVIGNPKLLPAVRHSASAADDVLAHSWDLLLSCGMLSCRLDVIPLSLLAGRSKVARILASSLSLLAKARASATIALSAVSSNSLPTSCSTSQPNATAPGLPGTKARVVSPCFLPSTAKGCL